LPDDLKPFAWRLRREKENCMDVLSEVLKVIKLEGAIFYNGEYSAPWSFRAPPSLAIAPYFEQRGGHVVFYHLLTEGQCIARLEAGQQVAVSAGELVIFPHGDAHIMSSGPGVEPVDYEGLLHQILGQGLTSASLGGGGEVTRFVCGYMSCDSQLSGTLLASLPPILKVPIRDCSAGQWLESSIRLSVGDACAAGAGSEAVLSKLSELLFVEALRRYIANAPAEQKGWLAAARDPEVGKTLALLHRKPAEPWTIATLAREVGISRAVLAERFRRYMGEPPMSYLTRWRLQLGARLLKSSSRSVAEIAAEVGYESEPAFNRAFKREFEIPPARYRSNSRTPNLSREVTKWI
jgi:AraC-like DNA-binding protein